ncbi:DUF2877 domain-containing protein [Lactobacillus sp. wkB10]|uniref:DUF2877 domain-containing protein n=1 Tax=Lactobacillus sp. wkB10 TaxID=1545701 RepID=UPI000513FABB|nr:DUF2877 domain-containing protein [Lactobacillus sp. wkB10]KGG53619.1 hypothetical protein LACWKB10_1600 [Lactobacillus sp. wkB10]
MTDSCVDQISSYIYPVDKFGQIGRVHSIFAHSLNIQVGLRLINISCFDNYLSCFGINISEKNLKSVIQSVTENNIVKFLDNNIVFYTQDGIKRIDVKNFNIVELKIKPLNYFPEKGLKKTLEVLNNCKVDQRIGIPNNTLLKKFSDEMITFKNFNAEQIVTWLLGRGKGLTPSGDDILCGYIFVLLLVDKANTYLSSLVKQIRNNLKLTTDVSKAYLICATQGYVNSKVYQLYKSFKNHNFKDIDSELNSILEIGHTSGKDLSYGIKLGILASLNTP